MKKSAGEAKKIICKAVEKDTVPHSKCKNGFRDSGMEILTLKMTNVLENQKSLKTIWSSCRPKIHVKHNIRIYCRSYLVNYFCPIVKAR